MLASDFVGPVLAEAIDHYETLYRQVILGQGEAGVRVMIEMQCPYQHIDSSDRREMVSGIPFTRILSQECLYLFLLIS